MRKKLNSQNLAAKFWGRTEKLTTKTWLLTLGHEGKVNSQSSAVKFEA
jgi:hypothetical protein